MKTSVLVAALFASAALAPIQAHAQSILGTDIGQSILATGIGSKTILFDLTVPKGSSCLPKASGRVVDHSNGPVEVLNVQVKGLPPNTGFDLFNIQVPNMPFGLAWYLGDIETDGLGVGAGTFIGRFNRETFIVSLGAVDSPKVFSDNNGGAKVSPVQIYHLGLWFNSPADAIKAGCAGTVTKFNGEHNAGIQVLNTGSFPDAQGPLFNLQ